MAFSASCLRTYCTKPHPFPGGILTYVISPKCSKYLRSVASEMSEDKPPTKTVVLFGSAALSPGLPLTPLPCGMGGGGADEGVWERGIPAGDESRAPSPTLPGNPPYSGPKEAGGMLPLLPPASYGEAGEAGEMREMSELGCVGLDC